MTRWIAWQEMLLSPNIKPGNKPKTAQAFCRFPWEVESPEDLKTKAEQYRVTDEEIKELNRIMEDWESRKNRPVNE